MVAVDVENRSGEDVPADEAVALIRDALAAEGVHDGELGLHFVGAAESRTLKREHLGVDEPTDVLSFPLDGREALPPGPPRQLGDLVVCPAVIGANWRAALVHGVLHLLGYDHGAEMSAREAELAR